LQGAAREAVDDGKTGRTAVTLTPELA
jgi:hypothetical protein